MLSPSTRNLVRPANRYQLLESLGAGGMGAVYRAFDRLTGQMCALKRLPQVPMRPVSSSLRLALAHEFQALAALRHPGVITVRDYGFDENKQPYFTMELLPSARNIVAAGELLPEAEKIALILQLLTTLIYIHRSEIIHRDLKPGNVLVTSGGEVKVLDFGLAGFPGEELPTSGTLPYMAPEMLEGQPASIQSDLYAAGVMAFELMAGWHPFTHSQNLAQSILREPPDFSLVDISAEIKAVVGCLLAKEPANRYRDAAKAISALCLAANRPLPPETEAARESFLQAAPFIGRTKSLLQLELARRQAAEGQGKSLLVAGESGIGKSRLLQELRIRALVDGMQVLQGQARPNEGAYHLWTELLRPLLLYCQPDDLAGSVLQTIVPDAAWLLNRQISPPPPLPPQEAQSRLHLTILELLQLGARERPLLILLEDLHWADENSLALLQLITSRLERLAVAVVGTFRPGERPQLAQELDSMAVMRLEPLSPANLSDLSTAMLGESGRHPELLRFLEREMEGNTFFIVEVVRALAEEAGRLDRVTAVSLPASIFPQGIEAVVQRRLKRIPAPDRKLLLKAAVAGRQLDLRLLAFLAPKSSLESWLMLCANAGVLEQPLGSPAWQFSHDKLREGLLRQTGLSQRQKLHRQIGAGLETIYEAELNGHYGNLAYHFGQGGMVEKERHFLGLAGDYAETTYANEAAISHYRQLLRLLAPGEEQAAIYLALGRVCKLSGLWQEAHDYLEAAAASPGAAVELQAQAFRLLGNLERGRQRYETAVPWLNQALAGYKQLNDWAGICLSQVEIANIFYHQGRYETALAHLAEAMRAAETADDAASLALVAHNLGSIAYSRGEYETAAAHFQEALSLRQLEDNPLKLADSYNNMGLVAFRQGDWVAAQPHLEQSLVLRRKVGDRWGTAASLSNLAMIPYQQKEFETARRYWQEALAVRRLLGDSQGTSGLLDNLALIDVAQGRFESGKGLIEEAVAIRRALDDRPGLAITLSNRGRLAFLMNDLAAAENDYRESLQLAMEIGDQLGLVFAMTGLAGVWSASGRLSGAALLLAAAENQLDQIGGSWESDEKAIFDKALEAVKGGLSTAEFETAWEEGRNLSVAAAIELVMENQDEPITG